MARYHYVGTPPGALVNGRALVTGPGRVYADAETVCSTQSVFFDNAGNLDFWTDTLGTYALTWDGGSASLTVNGTPGAAASPASVGDEWALLLTGLSASSTPVHVPAGTTTATGGSVSSALAQSADYRDTIARMNAGGLYVVSYSVRGSNITASINIGGDDYSIPQLQDNVTARFAAGDVITLTLSKVSADALVFIKIERVG